MSTYAYHRPKHARISTASPVITAILVLGCIASIGLSSPTHKPPSNSGNSDRDATRSYRDDPSIHAQLQERERQQNPARSAARVRTKPSLLAHAAPQETKGPRKVDPVGDLTQQQMDHAAAIVYAGEQQDLPDRALIVAITTALQESNLRNLANHAYPSSLDLPNDGTGYDHDSVGLFQQRASMGWGTIPELMDPITSAEKFYNALQRVSGWEGMSISRAAQSVQRSAYPNAYAKHESLAGSIVTALTE